MVPIPSCFEQQVGFITALPGGGVPPYAFSLDGINFQSTATFQPLDEGTYQIYVRDGNQCITNEIVWINQFLPVDVSLGDNTEILIGDTVILQAIVNIPVDSLNGIEWHGMH